MTLADSTIAAFAALGSSARIQILEALLDGPKRPSELAELPHQGLGMRYHCLTLIDAGLILVETVERGRRVLYHLNEDKCRHLAHLLIAMANGIPAISMELEEEDTIHSNREEERHEIRVQAVSTD